MKFKSLFVCFTGLILTFIELLLRAAAAN